MSALASTGTVTSIRSADARGLEFNRALDHLFASDDATELISLLCTRAPNDA